MATTTTRKKTSKRSTKKTGKRSTKKTATRKTASKRSTKKTSKRSTKRSAKPDAVSIPADDARNELNGTAILTPNGRAPKKGALAYLDEKQIKIVKGFNPRTSGIGDITELKRGIRTNGLLEPLVVRPSGNGTTYDLVAGERRLTALRELGGRFASEIPVLIRVDLEGDYASAKAAAANENSDDARTQLNVVELGQLATELRDEHGWDLKQIAKHTGHHEKKVRRAISIYEGPQTIREKVRAGEMSANAAMEFGQLDEERQQELIDKVGPGTTAQEIRQLRKRAEAVDRKEAASKGEVVDKRNREGKPSRSATVAAWMNPRTKTAWLRELCFALQEAEGEAIGTTDYHEIRGAVGWLLADRGDIESPYLPPLDPNEDEDPAAAKKLLAAFDAIVKQEADRYEPGEGEEDE